MKNPPTFLSEKFTPVTPKKELCKKLTVAEVISHYLKDTFGKNTFRNMAYLSFFGGFYKLKWPSLVQLTS